MRLYAALLAIAAALVLPAPANALTITRYAEAGFFSDDPCVRTDAYVTAREAADGDFAYAYVSREDSCTGASFFGDGEEAIPAKAFVVSGLRRATLNATVHVQNPNTGETRAVALELSWRATDPPETAWGLLFRRGIATGTISDGQFDYNPARHSYYANVGLALPERAG